ncbi:class I SAM-dependent methyltransferase [Cumulibacter manganitolerans]|uniref:class I SAM-dependent methyltransferase n=1 Tax=Cumulibacter manganitolerans TaxID=1884992 RepID=UPI001295E784|nr:methyltransferase domain-containing protein [Cumulibacter manganitolerans]
MSTNSTATDDAALKAAHAAMWALGDYPAVAADITTPLAPVLVDAARVARGHRVLDVASGTGNVAVEAAARGAHATASDLTPRLLDAGRAAGADRVEWAVADAEDLPFDDGSYDAVLSAIGVMFAPHHERAAAELLRVCRPGGTIGVASWTPDGFVGQMFAAMKPYAAPPPPGSTPPVLWGRAEHVTALLGDAVTDVRAERRDLPVHTFAGRAPSAFREYFKANYGPTIAAYRRNVDDPEATAALDAALDDLAARHRRPDGSMLWEYLVYVATRC